MHFRYSARSDVGVVRERNEDSGLAAPDLIVVADGMGGHAAGELASAIAVATIAEAEDSVSDPEALSTLADAVDLAADRISDVIAREPQFQGMGTTLTALAMVGEQAALVHVGDSRGYIYRDGHLAQITKDHTYVQTLVDSGRISAQEAATHPRRNLLMRAIDGIHEVAPDVSTRALQVGDRFLLCSDGLSGVITESEMAEVLTTTDPTGAVVRLVEMAVDAGAPDNVTVVIADVVADERDGRAAERPVVVGAAGERRVRNALPRVPWPEDMEPDPTDRPRDTAAQPPISAPVTPSEAPVVPEPQRVNWRRWFFAGIAVLLGALAVMGALLLWWMSSQWYVSASPNKTVAIYQGVPGSLGPIDLQVLDQNTTIPIDRLPDFQQNLVEQAIVVGSREAAENTVAELQAAARDCLADPTLPGCPNGAAP